MFLLEASGLEPDKNRGGTETGGGLIDCGGRVKPGCGRDDSGKTAPPGKLDARERGIGILGNGNVGLGEVGTTGGLGDIGGVGLSGKEVDLFSTLIPGKFGGGSALFDVELVGYRPVLDPEFADFV